MSGVKCSPVELARQRREKLALVREVDTLHGQAKGLVKHLKQVLLGASEELLSTFIDDVEQAKTVLKEARLPDVSKLDMDSSTDDLKKAKSTLSRVVEQVTASHTRLSDAFGKKANEMGRGLAKESSDTERLLAGGEDLLSKWYPKEQVAAWRNQLRRAADRLQAQEYGGLEETFRTVQGELQASIRDAESREEKHQRRRYVLTSIHKLCRSKGFNCIEKPHLEDPNDRGSRAIMVFDTSGGKIEFSLDLDGIHTESQLNGSRCWDDFGELSQNLDEMFGIKTDFRREDGSKPEDIELKGTGKGGKSRTVTRQAPPQSMSR